MAGYYPELGHGQHELPVRHAEALTAADNQVWVRESVRNVARAHGLRASIAPKPLLDQAGNGCHVHLSVWDADERRNLLFDAAAQGSLSTLGRSFTAGLLAHTPGLLALTAPSANSYRRLQPHSWSSAFTAWGFDNREATVRVCSPLWGHEAETLNLEYKASDPSSNPFLALGGLIAAGLDGINRELEPPPATQVDPGTLGAAERKQRGIRRYPTDQAPRRSPRSKMTRCSSMRSVTCWPAPRSRCAAASTQRSPPATRSSRRPPTATKF